MKSPVSERSALRMMLKALIPYSRENLTLSFSPNRFFNELEALETYKRSTLRSAYYRGKKLGLIEDNNRLSPKGLNLVDPFMPALLDSGTHLIVVFDIPESKRRVRGELRNVLRLWKFTMIQKSVWRSDRDYYELLRQVISELKINGYVQIFESCRLYP